MSTATETPAQHGLTAHSHGAAADEKGSAQSALDRFASFDVADHPVPHGKEEEWRFTPMSRLRGLHDDAALDGGDVAVSVDADPQVTVETVGADDPRRGTSSYVPVDRPSARAWEAAEKVLAVDIPVEAEIERPTFVQLSGSSAEQGAAGHIVITAGRHSKSVVVLEYGGSAALVDNVEVVAGDGAELTVVTVQDWADDAVHLSHHHVRTGRDATVKHAIITFGGDLVRTGTTLNYAGPGGDATLLGLYYADAGQHIENRLIVDHNTPNGTSDVEYKGALQGKKAHAVWIGDVLIRKEALGINTYELNRNLVLTDGARADSVPNLEIETGEIEGAGHASATGRFDDEQLFYLQARGIPADLARKLVVRGFFASLINRIGVPQLTERLMATVERELAVVEAMASDDASGGA
ncbi:Fe-S cluster assembly protein SufD [Actinobacteria bacterium YIM 96077]|uniref:Fe-S cluster assembly protein SufD n=1 Tax=Phytoactinopolyspora halophila TaxID=1981511 RepID=A0A329QLI0_9ACTN|nr:Fe-S cluster assembly protein SufD [Phytoactinopolyspora halophila]AYY12940.1 Fe-S cluster assembly protein SufD [Actinobacteria bacterium YIM 96077]RAW13204.1 Fe-S cluster assembly protein SufD [Phytoactinopolyspora halophila]